MLDRVMLAVLAPPVQRLASALVRRGVTADAVTLVGAALGLSGSTVLALGHPLAGLLVDEVSPAVARQLGLGAVTGVVVAGIDEGSLAEAAGLIPGDLILEVNHQPVADLFAYQRLVEPIKPKDLTLLMINRQGTLLYVPIEGE